MEESWWNFGGYRLSKIVLVVKNLDRNGVLTNSGNENDPDIDGETSTGLESGDKV